MTTQTIFIIILGIYIAETLLTKTLAHLNTTRWSEKLPKELKGIYDEKKYQKSQKYEKEKYVFSTISSSITFIFMFIVLITGGFGSLDTFLRSMIASEFVRTLVYFLFLTLVSSIVSLPFSYYGTFVLEEKYGFNKMTKSLFFSDTVKGLVLSVLIGGPLISAIIYFYQLSPEYFWLYAWVLVTGFSLFMMMFYSSLIVPLFNKQEPLEEGKLKKEIFSFSQKVGFPLTEIYVIDGSKRSSKANAYFSGFGPKKRIVLFDTLIKDLTVPELIAVLAHEIGHYKKKHTLQMLAFSIVQTGLMLFILSLALKVPEVSYALGGLTESFHLGIIAFGILFTPISLILGVLSSMLSRKNEYEADHYAKENFNGKYLESALIKLSRNNLSNLRPHPAYEFFYYSHPTVLKRLEALKK